MSSAAIMIVTYNRLDLTKRTMNNIMEMTDFPFRIIIVDNGSTDGTIDYLESLKTQQYPNKYFKEFTIKYNEKNLGYAIARNQCLLIAKQFNDNWLSTIDNDVEVPAGWLTECINVLKLNPNYGIMGVNMEDVSYPLITVNGKTFQRKPMGNLGNACTVYNKKLHEKLGFYNTEYTPYGHEDADWGMRIRVLGLELGYIKTSGVHVGQGKLDVGEYREFKNEWGIKNLNKFKINCGLYLSKRKSLYIPFSLEDIDK